MVPGRWQRRAGIFHQQPIDSGTQKTHQKVRIRQGRPKPLHSLRSTGITRMLANGGKLDFVMKIAGHSNPQTTLNHYVRSENFDLHDTVNLLSN